MQRRSFVLGAASVPLAVGARVGHAAEPDHYRSFLALIEAWKRRDVDAVVGMMAEDIVWYPAVGRPPMNGRAAVRAALEALAPKRAEERWKIFNYAVNGNLLFVEGADDYTDDAGHRVAVPYAGVIEYRDGLVVAWRDYFDIATLDAMKAGGPVPAQLEPLLARPGEP